MIFSNVKKGDIIYCAEIINSEFIDDKIIKKEVIDVKNNVCYIETDAIEISFNDNTFIVPNKNDTTFISNKISLNDKVEPLDITIYSCDYDMCVNKLKEILIEKLSEVNKIYEESCRQLSKLSLINIQVSEIKEKNFKEKVVLDVIYTD